MPGVSEATRHALVGRTLSDFVVREPIGEGGMGTVYRAEQPALGREAVIKTLREDHRNDARIIERFLREAKLASRIDHPYAAHIYAFGAEPDGLLWIAMELVRGTPLDALVAAQGPVPLERFVPLLECLCEVIHTAHEAGIVHRDLKPANVVVIARAGRLLPKLLDLGIAKLIGAEATDHAAATPSDRPAPQSTQVGTVLGSPHYMAPEQWVAPGAVGPAADVYALGAIAYQALTGRPPFDGPTELALAKAHAREPVPPLGDRYPAELDAVLARAMAKRPDQRYPGALELAAAFRRASGIADAREALPALDEGARARALAEAPEPIAEAVARLEATRSLHQARDALWGIVDAAARYVGNLALACRTRVGAGGDRDGPDVVAALGSLRRGELSAPQWIALARDLCRPFARRAHTYPLPELVELWAADPFEPLWAGYGAAERGAAATEEQVRAHLVESLPRVAVLLRELGFLDEYALVVGRESGADLRRGVRRSHGAVIDVAGPPLADGSVALLDAARRPLLDLGPVIQAARPSPEAPEEIFVLSGNGRHGARLVAESRGFEHHDEQVWSWFASHFFGDEDAGTRPEETSTPYRGLAAFTRGDAELFFGRARETDAFVNRLRVHPLLCVVGPSGAGKSSFVEAGVVPALGPSWRAITVRPGPAPLAALAARLAQEGIDVAGLGAELADDPGALGARLRAHAGTLGGPLLLVVDQFEELFTLGASPDERERYSAVLAGAARSADDAVRVVFTMRDDFLARAAQLPAVRGRLAAGLQLLTTPVPDELLEIVTAPPGRLGYEFDDPDLPHQMVAAVADQPGALALLSFTAATMWEVRDRHFKRLTRKSYDSIGGVGGALAQHAEATIEAMSHEQRALVREAFRHLVTAEGTRAVLRRSELRQVLGDDDRADAVIEQLIGARLLVAAEAEQGGDRIEVIHEALLTGWPRLVTWRQEDAEGARLRDQLRVAARQWEGRGRSRGMLWRGDALAEYRLWRSRFPGQLTAAEEAFAQASVRDALRGRRLRRLALTVVIAGLAVGIVALYRANERTAQQRSVAAGEARRSLQLLHELHAEQGREAVLAGDPLRGLVHLSEAYRRGADGSALRHLLASAARATELELASLRAHSGFVTVVRFSPDGRWLATAGNDGARLWDGATYAPVRQLDPGERVGTLEFDRAGARVLTSNESGMVRLWDVDGGRELLSIQTPHRAMQHKARLGHDGSRILSYGVLPGLDLWDAATGGLVAQVSDIARMRDAVLATEAPIGVAVRDDGGAVVFDADDGRVLSRFPTAAEVYDVRLDPPGTRLATTHAGFPTAYVWDTRTGAKLHALEHAGPVMTAFFSPDGARIVTSSRDATAKVWDAATGRLVASLEGHSGAVQLGETSHAGDWVVTCGLDASCRLWESRTGQPIAAFAGHQRAVDTAQFDTRDQRVATGARDGVVKVWAVRQDALVHTLAGHGAPLTTATYSPDGARLLTFDNQWVGRVWNAETGQLIRELPVLAVDSRPNRASGELLTLRGTAGFHPSLPRVVLPVGRRARIWDIDTGEVVADWEQASRFGPDPPHWVKLSTARYDASGERLVTAGFDGVITVWDAGTGKPRWRSSADDYVLDAVFSPDGKRLATGGRSGCDLWDADSGKRLRGSADYTSSVVFDASGERLLTVSRQTIAVRDAGDLSVRLSIRVAGDVSQAAFSRDGARIAAGVDRSIRIWDATTGNPIGEFRIPARAVWTGFDPADARVVAADVDGAASVWDVRLETRGPEEIAELVRCSVPFAWNGQQLVPSNPEEACANAQ